MPNEGMLLQEIIRNKHLLQDMIKALNLSPVLDAKFYACEYSLLISFTVPGTIKRYPFYISQMTGQCGVLVVWNIPCEYYKKELNQNICDTVHEISRAIMLYLKYGMMMLTHTSMVLMQHYRNNDWQFVSDFYNPHSGNDVWILTYEEDNG